MVKKTGNTRNGTPFGVGDSRPLKQHQFSSGRRSGKNNYEVGYGKPPSKHKFKPGQSGNPSGRRKTSPDVFELAANELKRKRYVTVEGRRVSMRTIDIVLRKVAIDAMNGKLAAVQQILALAAPAQEKERQKEIRYTKIHLGMTPLEAAKAFEDSLKGIGDDVYDEDEDQRNIFGKLSAGGKKRPEKKT